MKRFTLLSVAVACLLVASVPCSATEDLPPLGAPGDPRVKAVQVLGEPDGDRLKLTLTPGPAATKAIRVYSEPSHTLLAIAIDSRFAATSEGKAWLEQFRAEAPAAFLRVTLPTGVAEAMIAARPESDDRVAVYVNGQWPDGTVKDRLISDGMVGGGRFAFTTYALPGEDPTHCCSGGTCQSQCTDCAGVFFSCCTLTDCCWIKCGRVIGGCASGTGCVP